MKLLVVVLVVAVAMVSTSAATSKFRRQILSDVDTKTIPAILKNKAAVETHVSCVVSDDQKALEICDKVGKKLRGK